MNHKTRLRLLLLAALILTLAACQKKKPPAEERPAPTDYVAPSPVGSSQTILHKAFPVTTSATFSFEVPARAAMPRLHGTYKSFVAQLAVQSSDAAANVDFLILNEDQYADFAQGHAGEALFSAEASHDQDVNLGLPPSQDQPKKYYLVFRNTPSGAPKKLVQADFTVDF
jgi:predicted small lipoprotein YifL